MRLRVRSGISQSAFRKQKRSRMARDFARLGYLVTERPLSDDLIADLVHALEDDEEGFAASQWQDPNGSKKAQDE